MVGSTTVFDEGGFAERSLMKLGIDDNAYIMTEVVVILSPSYLPFSPRCRTAAVV